MGQKHLHRLVQGDACDNLAALRTSHAADSVPGKQCSTREDASRVELWRECWSVAFAFVFFYSIRLISMGVGTFILSVVGGARPRQGVTNNSDNRVSDDPSSTPPRGAHTAEQQRIPQHTLTCYNVRVRRQRAIRAILDVLTRGSSEQQNDNPGKVLAASSTRAPGSRHSLPRSPQPCNRRTDRRLGAGTVVTPQRGSPRLLHSRTRELQIIVCSIIMILTLSPRSLARHISVSITRMYH